MNKSSFLCLIGGILALAVAMGIARFSYTPILPLMQEDLSFSDAAAGYLASSNYAGYLVGAVIVGILPLKSRRAFYLRVSLVVSIVTTFSMGFTHAYWLMMTIRFLSGVASAFIFVLTSSIVLDRLAANGKTNYAGFLYAGVGLGIFLSSILIPGFNALFAWNGAWVSLAFISAAFGIFIWMWLKDSSNLAAVKEKPQSTFPVPPAKWLRYLMIAYGLEGLGYIVTGTFIVSIAERTPSFHGDPAFVWMVVGLAVIPSCFIWSTLAKRKGFVTALIWAMGLQAFGIALPVFSLSPIALFISACLFGATFMGISTLTTTVARQMSPHNSSQIIGYLTAVYAIGQMIGPSIAGVLTTFTENYHAALIGAASVVFLGGAFLLTGLQYDKKTAPVKYEWK